MMGPREDAVTGSGMDERTHSVMHCSQNTKKAGRVPPALSITHNPGSSGYFASEPTCTKPAGISGTNVSAGSSGFH